MGKKFALESQTKTLNNDIFRKHPELEYNPRKRAEKPAPDLEKASLKRAKAVKHKQSLKPNITKQPFISSHQTY